MAKKTTKKSGKSEVPPAAIIGRSAQPNFLTNQEKAMLSAAISLLGKFDLSTQLPVGEYPIDGKVIIDLAGLAKKFGQEEYIPTVAIPHTLVLDAVLSKMGAVSQAAEAQIFSVLEEAMDQIAHGSISTDGLKGITNRREEIAARTRARLDAMPKRTRDGKFCAHGDITAIKVEGAEQEQEQGHDEDSDSPAGVVVEAE